ncbi:hypothetical protein [Streptomyces sp. NPDC048411]|uniref:hypothetical protein n=1 Tax=Streptomyces sp. NPDC048411 TaxID=3157206 RepID=UPI0034518D80
MTSGPPTLRLLALLGFTGAAPTRRRGAVAADLAAAAVTVVLVALLARALPLPGWLGPLLGGCVAVAALRSHWGSRFAGRGPDGPTEQSNDPA